MAASPVHTTDSGSGDTVIAQYLATKVAWWATYPRILVVTPATLSTYNPETFQCTNQWEIADIEAVDMSPTGNQFVLRLEKSRFRSAKLKFMCSARGHLLSLLARLRRQAQGKALLYRVVSPRRLHFRCIEQFANASHQLLFLQVTVSSVVFLDDCGRRVQILPFLYLRRAAFSSAHSEGMVLSTAFHDRFFLCGERHECLNEIVAAANDAGVELYKTSSTITALQLRLQNTQVLDRPSVIRFDVKKARNTEGNGDAAPGSDGSDGTKKAFKKIQLILQGDAVVEMHRSMRTVVARPYSALLAIVRPDWDPRTLVLEFKQEDTLVLDVEGRDQLVTLLLLVCREAGHHNVMLISSGLNYCRFYHPHSADTAVRDDSSVAGASMETFLLRRITQTGVRPEDNGGRSRGNSVWSPRRRRGASVSTPRGSQANNDTPRSTDSDSSARGGWFQRRIKEKRSTEPHYETRNSIDSGLSMNESVSITIAMEELNANLPLDELTRSGPGQVEVVNKALELVFEHLVTLIASLRRYGDTTSSELITTLQALVRLYHHPNACFTDETVPRVFDAVHELILQQDVLTCYWCLRLLQCFLGVRTPNTAANYNAAGDQRAKMIQHFVHNGTLQHAIVDLIPASFAASNNSSVMANSSTIGEAFWLADPDVVQTPPSSLSSSQSSILCTKEARVQSEINVVFYETLLTLHHLLVYLKSSAKMQRASRDRQNYIAAGNRQIQHGSYSDVPAETHTDVLAGKLLEKYRFLMDSIVDVRLVRMAETSVALVQFVLNHFATKTTASQLQLGPSDNQLSHSGSGEFHGSRKRRLGALGSFLDDYRAVTESRAETQSLLFGTERTIEMPLDTFSYATTECTNAAMERLLNPGTTNRIGTVLSNGSMRLEYLDPSEPPSSIRDDDPYTKPLEPEIKKKPSQKEIHLAPPKRLVYKKPSEPHKHNAYDSLASINSNQVYQPSLPSSVKRLVGQTSPIRSIRSDVGANLFKSDDEDDTIGPLLHSDHVSTAARSPRAIRKAFQASVGARRTANECDACIGCNDVCTNERCFFCAEKEYQLKVAFAGSSVATGPTVRQAAWQHRAPSSVESSFNVEREYSSCEMKRHQSQRSCWIRVDDSVYDVTDLLGVHPGGAQVLLEAAQHGGDCGPILKTHPPAAREMLTQYRLGRYYECNKC